MGQFIVTCHFAIYLLTKNPGELDFFEHSGTRVRTIGL